MIDRRVVMDVAVWVWVVTIVGFSALLVFDFYAHVRKPHEPSFRESAWWSVFYVVLALVFGVGLALVEGSQYGAEYIAGYITEKSLSVDNLFIFLIIMQKFAVPKAYQQRVLLIGVVIALLMRGLFIAAGAAALAYFSWVFYIFGFFLLYTAWKLAWEKHDEDEEYEPPAIVRAAQRVMPTTTEYHGTDLFTRIDGRRYATPMLMVMIAIGMTDLLFALDSIPAIFGLTEEPYIVFTANAFALLGLMQLYFLLGGLLQRLVYLGMGLAVILGFIGVKLVLHALHTNTLPFINGGQPIHWIPEVPIWLSLTVILTVLVVTTVASLMKSRRDADAEARSS
jgi:tellurite resistance protein TerC